MDKSIEKKLPIIKKIFLQYGAYNVYLFGSYATGTNNDKSDIDFIFSFPKELNYEQYADNYFNLLNNLEEELNMDVDLVAEKTLENPYLIQKINSQKIKIL